MVKNVGNIDRVARVLLACFLAFLAWAPGVVLSADASVDYWLTVVVVVATSGSAASTSGTSISTPSRPTRSSGSAPHGPLEWIVFFSGRTIPLADRTALEEASNALMTLR